MYYWCVLVGALLYLCVLVLTDCVLVCFGMYSMYNRYLYVLVSMSQYFMYWPAVICAPNSMYNWQYLYVFACVDVCCCVSLCITCISKYSVNWPVQHAYCNICSYWLDSYFMYWSALCALTCIARNASIDWYHFTIHAKDLHNTYQNLNNRYILVQCSTVFQTMFNAPILATGQH